MMAGGLAYFHGRICEALNDKNAAVRAMGDFNDEPFKRPLVDHALPRCSRTKEANPARFWNLMRSIVGQGSGTHYYDNMANGLDQFLVSRGLATGSSRLQGLPDTVEVLWYPKIKSPGL